ncbi:MAG: fluoride efflux transporter CrcB [Vannielia sp.]|uniref:fluoride efflux transporter CrcB n=1 Tax=Rhodobacterales TaxID=204455 RepID=UPI002095C516|nr:fluoride efflux transporter CrcB [Oceanicola sp. 502str15]MCO6383952.1 fluoride efflux transporter CrcB [Oceanicola sp. 502str15]
MISTLAQVALGGALGASARYLTGVAAIRLMGPGFPWGTLTVNVVGSLLMGLFAALVGLRGGHAFSPLVMTGLLGGFTTFSAFSLDAVTLFERGQVGTAALYVVVSVTFSILALFVGLALGRGVFA